MMVILILLVPLHTASTILPLLNSVLKRKALVHENLATHFVNESIHSCWWEVDTVVASSKICGCWMLTEECGVRLVS